MLRGYRGVVVALIGLGLLILAVVGYYRVQDAQYDPYPDARHNPARNATEPVPSQDKQVAPPTYDPSCQAPQNREDSDLCAQWSAVEAMKEANRVTQIALRAGWFEFMALLISIFFTGWAAMAASRAATFAEEATKDADTAIDIAKKNAEAAIKLASVSEKTAERQLRAYLSMRSATFIEAEDSDDIQVMCEIINNGQTPAIITHLNIIINWVNKKGFHTIKQSNQDSNFECFSQTPISYSVTIPNNFVHAKTKGEMHVAGRIDYIDVFGEPRKALFAFRSTCGETFYNFPAPTRLAAVMDFYAEPTEQKQ